MIGKKKIIHSGEYAVVDGELVKYGVGREYNYFGMFLNDKRHGIGRCSHYMGEYKEGKRHGQATSYNKHD